MADLILSGSVQFSECLVEAVWLEHWVPSEHVLATRLHDLSIAAPCEDDGLGIWTFAESEDALGIGCLVFKVLYHLPQSLTTDTAQEVLAVDTKRRKVKNCANKRHSLSLTCMVQAAHYRH